MSDKNPVPLINVTAQNQPLLDEMMTAIRSIIENSSFILGPEVKKFEEEFQAYTKVNHAISCASGTDALLLPLMSAEVGPGDEVLVPSFTFYATAGSVARLGATPIFVDSDDSYNICLKDLAKKITNKTKAVIPVHLFGQMVDMPELLKVVQASASHKICIIEDCAQSIGSEINGKQSGTYGDYGAYSFYPTKNLGAIGDAGMMSANTPENAERLQMLRVHGSKKRYYHELVGVNSRLDSIQAAVLRIKLRHLKNYEEKRASLADLYTKLFTQAGLLEKLRLPVVGKNRRHVWNQYTIRVKERDSLKSYLAEQAVGSEIYYPLAMHKQTAFEKISPKTSLPTCEALEREVLSLPMFPELQPAQVETVVAKISDFYKK